ncbi:unnamed protein product [Tilletia controversa]|uniref:Uncharacterized protein n=2 Tax=Tilletia TaxID=13289 RepID=A0A177TYQ1_9BASI|nr:hypothetical protein CF336_g6248 [Tilletia laevis]KAE8256457.1 hypothetical protein A4X03_0g5387 [Tilletia caries]CAD6896062.1 unnamed protein product [Tilletia controversa]KAE8193525.1 hypothetical protein CF335_g5565 [Tilletia laevis]CAD6887162.1 unnamed protein product [Tilletia caries]
MRLATLSFLAAIFTAAVATDRWPNRSSGWAECRYGGGIEKLCPNVHQLPDDRFETTLKVVCLNCLHKFWAESEYGSKHGECPHPEVGCHCYNGCVHNMWRNDLDQGFHDVGGVCKAWCGEGAQPLPPKCWK